MLTMWGALRNIPDETNKVVAASYLDPDETKEIQMMNVIFTRSIAKASYPHVHTLWNQRKQVVLKSGILYKRYKDVSGGELNPKLQLGLSPSLASVILSTLHNSHVGSPMNALIIAGQVKK